MSAIVLGTTISLIGRVLAWDRDSILLVNLVSMAVFVAVATPILFLLGPRKPESASSTTLAQH